MALQTLLLICSVLPHIIPFDLEEEVNTGESVQLNCHVSKGDPPLKISWNFHGATLSSHMGISTTKLGERSSVLTINSAMAAHSGNYTCTATNNAGSTSYTATVHVNGIAFTNAVQCMNVDLKAHLHTGVFRF